MTKCTIRYTPYKDTIHEICYGEIVKEDSDEMIIHPSEDSIKSVLFDKNRMTVRVCSNSNIREGEIHGYKKWESKFELQIQIKERNTIDSLNEDEYFINVNGFVDKSYSHVNEHYVKVSVNNIVFTIEYLDKKISVNSNSNKINIEVSNDELGMDGTFVNIGIDEPIEDFNIFNNIRDSGVKDYGYLSEIDT